MGLQIPTANRTICTSNHAWIYPQGRERDHLGNNREVWYASYNKWEKNADQMGYHTVGIPAATSQQTQYYPSGLPWTEGLVPSEQPYKYNGKEFVEMHGYDTYDYGARGYYPAMGRWTSVDPLAEKYYNVSPYAYCKGNPIRYIDPDGKFVLDANLARQYPFLAQLVKTDMQGFKNDAIIMNSLMKYGQFSRKQILNNLQINNGPQITSEKMDDALGKFRPYISSNNLRISTDFLNEIKAATGEKREELIFLLSIKILHEYVHYGDDQDYIDYKGEIGKGEEGEAFEIACFAIYLNKYNVGIFAESWKQDREYEKEKSENKRKIEGYYVLSSNNFSNAKQGVTYRWNGSSWQPE